MESGASRRQRLDLFDPNAPWGGELAWTAANLATFHGDECDEECNLQELVKGLVQYWSFYPEGSHIADALGEAAKTVGLVADGTCDRTSPETAERTAVSAKSLADIRSSLADVKHPGKEPITASLDEIERRCRR